MAAGLLSLSVRHCVLGRIYGPGMPPLSPPGLVERPFEAPVRQVGLVAVHCWNLGEPDGPYPFPPGTRCPSEPADWVPRAHEIVRERIRPAMDAARRAGITVFHLAGKTYAARYPSYAAIAADPELREPEGSPPWPPKRRCVRPCGEGKMTDICGPSWPGSAWETHPKEFDIARAVRPVGNEPVVTDGWQLNGLCRRLDIDTLFYCGFMADVCLMNSPGAMREMGGKFGYRCIVLRDGTTAYEWADTADHMCMTNAAIRMIEVLMGGSVTSAEFIAAARRAPAESGSPAGRTA